MKKQDFLVMKLGLHMIVLTLIVICLTWMLTESRIHSDSYSLMIGVIIGHILSTYRINFVIGD